MPLNTWPQCSHIEFCMMLWASRRCLFKSTTNFSSGQWVHCVRLWTAVLCATNASFVPNSSLHWRILQVNRMIRFFVDGLLADDGAFLAPLIYRMTKTIYWPLEGNTGNWLRILVRVSELLVFLLLLCLFRVFGRRFLCWHAFCLWHDIQVVDEDVCI